MSYQPLHGINIQSLLLARACLRKFKRLDFFRYSKAMHMLEAGINLVYIRDFLGHTSTTMEIYARASEKLKEQALEKLTSGIIQKSKTTW